MLNKKSRKKETKGTAPEYNPLETNNTEDEEFFELKEAFKIACKVALAVFVFITLVVGRPFYKVSEQQQAVVTRFGVVQNIRTAGLYLKIPFIDKVQKVYTTTHGMPIGYTGSAGEDQDNAASVEKESLMITSDFNFLNVDFYLEYRVSDPIRFLYGASEPEKVLKNLALAAIRTTISDYTVDDAMTTGKAEIQGKVKESLTKALDDIDIGLSVVNVSIQDVEPPTNDVMSAFKSVENAKQGASTAVNNAEQYKSEQLPAAKANADKIVQNAEAKKAARIAEAEGQVARFNKMYEQYQAYPLVTKKRMFYETMEDILPDLKVIVDDGNVQKMMPLQQFSTVETVGTKEGE